MYNLYKRFRVFELLLYFTLLSNDMFVFFISEDKFLSSLLIYLLIESHKSFRMKP